MKFENLNFRLGRITAKFGENPNGTRETDVNAADVDASAACAPPPSHRRTVPVGDCCFLLSAVKFGRLQRQRPRRERCVERGCGARDGARFLLAARSWHNSLLASTEPHAGSVAHNVARGGLENIYPSCVFFAALPSCFSSGGRLASSPPLLPPHPRPRSCGRAESAPAISTRPGDRRGGAACAGVGGRGESRCPY